MSYNTVEDCDLYLQTHYLETDDAYGNWEALTDEDKQVLLNKAHDILELLPYIGKKTVPGQPDAFPRCPQTTVPYEIKAAECEQALAFSDVDATEAFEDYRRAVKYGISSYSIGNFKETLLTYGKFSVEVTYGLSSDIAKRLITPWLSGGYRIG